MDSVPEHPSDKDLTVVGVAITRENDRDSRYQSTRKPMYICPHDQLPTALKEIAAKYTQPVDLDLLLSEDDIDCMHGIDISTPKAEEKKTTAPPGSEDADDREVLEFVRSSLCDTASASGRAARLTGTITHQVYVSIAISRRSRYFDDDAVSGEGEASPKKRKAEEETETCSPKKARADEPLPDI